VSLSTLVIIVAIVVASTFISRLTQAAVRRGFKARGVTSEGQVGVFTRLVHYTTILVGFGVALETAGVDLSALFAAGAVFAVGLGFAMQNIAQNFVSGVILLAERVIKPGDILEIDGQVVRVVEMGIRATVVRSRDDEDIIVPNGILAQSAVTNFTMRDSVYRIRVPVGVTYSSDMPRVQEVLAGVADAFEGRLPDLTPRVILTGFGASSVDFEVSVWVDDPWEAPMVRARLHHAVFAALKEAAITIAFPQVDVHFDAPRESLPKAA
jgi:small-conductance mechanosensitive channel